MPFYVGDYLRDTGHLTTVQHGAYFLMIMHCWQHEKLPPTDEGRAAVARIPLKQWLAMKATIEAFFQPDGSHKRVTEEIEKSEKKWMQRSIAGRTGGMKSGIARSIKQANGQAKVKQKGSERFTERSSKRPSGDEAKTNLSRTNHKEEDITSTFSVAAREESLEPTNTAPSLATAPRSGALARAPLTEQAAKRPHEISRAEFDAKLAASREGKTH